MRQKNKKPEDFIGRFLGIAGRALKHRFSQNLANAGFDLATEQIILMRIIEASEGVNQQYLTDLIPHDKAAVTRWIDILQERELVTRVPDHQDRRQNLIFLTEMGRDYVASAHPIFLQAEREAFDGVSESKIRACKEVLKQIAKNLME